MRLLVPDWRNRIRVGIKAGGTGAITFFTNQQPTNPDMILQLACPFVPGVAHADVLVTYPSMAGATDIFLSDTVDTASDDTLVTLPGSFQSLSQYLSSLSFPSLATVGGDMTFNPGIVGDAPIVAISFPALTSAKSFQINLNANDTGFQSLTSLSLPSLVTIGVNGFIVQGNGIVGPQLTGLALPSLITAGSISITNISVLTALSTPALQNCGNLVVFSNALAGSLSFPALVSASDISVSESSITGLNLPVLSGCSSVTLNSSSATTLNIPSLINVGSLNCNECTGLTTLNVAGTINGVTTVQLIDCGLTGASIDAILAGIANGTSINGTFDSSGGSSSAPGPTGTAAIAVIQGRGWQVLTN